MKIWKRSLHFFWEFFSTFLLIDSIQRVEFTKLWLEHIDVHDMTDDKDAGLQ